MSYKIKYRSCLLVLICFAALNTGYAQDTTWFDSEWNTTTKDKAAFYSIDKKTRKHWLRKDYFADNHQLMMTGRYSSVDPDVKDGLFLTYFRNKKIKHRGRFKDDVERGVHYWYFENGKTQAIERYKNGQLHGYLKEYNANGSLKFNGRYRDGLLDGTAMHYNGKGVISSWGNYNKGLKEGVWMFFDDSGRFIETEVFRTLYTIYDAHMEIRLPNNEWYALENKEPKNKNQHFYGRAPLDEEDEYRPQPVIRVFTEDARSYKQNVPSYSKDKQKLFFENGYTIEEVWDANHANYPLNFPNGVVVKSSYVKEGMPHVVFMVHCISQFDRGIEIYIDISEETFAEIEDEVYEFFSNIRMLKNLFEGTDESKYLLLPYERL